MSLLECRKSRGAFVRLESGSFIFTTFSLLKGRALMLRGRTVVRVAPFGSWYNAAVALLDLLTARGNQVAQALRCADNKLNSHGLLFGKQQREMNGRHVFELIRSLFPFYFPSSVFNASLHAGYLL